MAHQPPERGPDRPSAPGGAGWSRRRKLVIAAVAGLVVIAVAAAAFLLNRPRTETSTPAPSPSAPTPTPTPTPSATPTPTPEPAPTDLNILLIGSDSRVDARGPAAAGAGSDQRGDVLVFLHLPADRKSIYGISVMRDLWVDIPGHGPGKVNSALELGGIPLMTTTVGTLLGQPIQHTVLLDFPGFVGLTDALNGIDVDVKTPFTSTLESGHYFPPGINHLNGELALDFVRERKAFADGDYQRVRNQQTFLKAVLGKALGGGYLTDPAAARALAAGVLPHVSVTPGLTPETLQRLAFSLRSVPPGNGSFFSLPTAGIGTSPDGQSIVVQNQAATAEVAAALASGTLVEYVTSHNVGGN
ncbi:LCP family protein [Arthrobacter sp. B3I4]|uniref:LCP family protein n=1 Tax=Arthrobacter sp. B3I4 TaxID=3042267 RepID=UPI0027860491|nr:LCP family protein [Arthrobacter sp. B3I4]MDQ0755323.1 LCP family protein required for cell wall assembly [Arthrobacter sp. B3I4]